MSPTKPRTRNTIVLRHPVSLRVEVSPFVLSPEIEDRDGVESASGRSTKRPCTTRLSFRYTGEKNVNFKILTNLPGISPGVQMHISINAAKFDFERIFSCTSNPLFSTFPRFVLFWKTRYFRIGCWPRASVLKCNFTNFPRLSPFG
jgi:hypothetical protein